ncbi:ATP-dependent DNA helicase [Neomicrococcus lactis]|uniref:ATP-dependent DNA helicase n=1 Tax=Neomicrococcus lactis TaxID=732241 RepID=UPI0023017B16|nr:ATP-dependent DNA helicase [Neomicrococcus lactis]
MNEEELNGAERVDELLKTAVSKMGGQERPGQHEMARKVIESFEQGGHLLVQAGTGTGKSLGYLVPSIYHSLTAEKPIIISTATLALQSQIVGRDLPRLLKHLEPDLPREVDAVLLKGRSNYVCQHKLEGGYPEEPGDALFEWVDGGAAAPHQAASPTSQLGQEIVRLREWAENTDTGDRDELIPGVSDKAWRQVSVSALECLGAQKCPVAEACFSEVARKKAAEADIVVTNHALLAISAFEGLAVLPEFDTVVIDEAHELQDRVTNSVTKPLSVAMIAAAASAARKHAKVIVEPLERANRAFEASVSNVSDGLLIRGVTEEQREALTMVREAARVVASDIKIDANAADGAIQMAKSQVLYVIEQAERLLEASPQYDVVWAARPREFVPGSGYQTAAEDSPGVLYVAPLSVGIQLREGLFEDRTVVLTSATLAIGAAFDNAAGSLGLRGEGAPSWSGIDVGSPFDYAKQGVLYVAKHLDAPTRDVNPRTYDEIERLINASEGGTLALFSSRRAADEAAAELRKRVDYKILCQGESSMKALVEEFSENEATCLFGTMSLWQGVDVPGTSCRLVIIDRIPFPRPDEPLIKARSQDVDRRGGSGFMDVSVSSAAIKLAQGAGRLIRSSDDRGVVAILDSRLVSRRYGGFIKASLPPMWSTTDPDVVTGVLKRLAAAAKN